MGDLNSRHSSLTVLETGKSKTKALAHLMTVKGLLPDSGMAVCASSCPHLERERERERVEKREGGRTGVFSYKDTDLIMGDLTS
jgi:hypothetical protein